MEPKNTSMESRDTKDVLSPTLSYPVDTEDCFELAYEADEFGVCLPGYITAK